MFGREGRVRMVDSTYGVFPVDMVVLLFEREVARCWICFREGRRRRCAMDCGRIILAAVVSHTCSYQVSVTLSTIARLYQNRE